MASASSSSSLTFRLLSSAPCRSEPRAKVFFPGGRFSSLPPRAPLCVAFARRKKADSKTTTRKNKSSIPERDDDSEDHLDDDALEALFSQLEEDLKNDESADDFDDVLSEEDLIRLEQELEEALGADDDYELLGDSKTDDIKTDDEVEEEEQEEEEEEERPVKLKTWQLRRLASALKMGKRKTRIKNLAAELGLDRSMVLELLKNPPPNLLLMSASLPDKLVEDSKEPAKRDQELEASPKPMETAEETVQELKPEGKAPIHVMVNRWSTQKRLKKVQIDTMERVYCRTKRPTNSMISSIVHLTNLPRKTVVKWFEDKRDEDGVPHHRLPFRRSVPKTILPKS